MPLIVVFGSLNIDFTSYVARHPVPGETVTGLSFAVVPGGKGANQAVACAKLSCSRPASAASSAAVCGYGDGRAGRRDLHDTRVAMIGAVGGDGYGQTVVDAIARLGVDTSAVRRLQSHSTGVALVSVAASGENHIVVHPGANASHQPADFASADFLLLPARQRPDLLVMQLEIPADTAVAAALSARRAGVPVLLNAAPVAGPLPDAVYDGLACLVVNETETVALLSEPASAGVGPLDDEEALAAVAAWFMARGLLALVVTLGGRGAYLADGRTGCRRLVPATPVDVVDTTAAGDTFVGALALEITAAAAAGAPLDLEQAVRTANKAAGLSVQRKGSLDSIPWRDELM